MISLKRKALLKRLDPKQVSHDSKTPQIVISTADETDHKNDIDSIESSQDDSDENQAKHLLQIPDEVSDEYSESSDDEDIDTNDLILNELKALKSRAQEIHHEVRHLTLRTQDIQNDLDEVRILKEQCHHDDHLSSESITVHS